MKVQRLGILAALLLGVVLLPVPVLAGAPANLSADASLNELAAPRTAQCDAGELARLSAAIEDARTTWAQTRTASSYEAFKAARVSYAQRATACSRLEVGSGSPRIAPYTGELPQSPQSTSGAPLDVPTAGIAVDIRSTSDEVIAGLDVTYSVTVTTGSSDAADSTVVSVAVTLPVAAGGPQYVDDTGGCVFATPTLTCALGTIARGGASKSFLVRMSTPPDLFFDGTTTLAATAVVTRAEADAVAADNTNASSTLVTEQSDLRVFKYMLPSTPVAGELAQYTIWVENRGPSTARHVVVWDTLLNGPADASGTNTSIQSCAFSVAQGGGVITQFTCTTGQLVGTQFGTDIGTFATNRLDPLDFTLPPPVPADPNLIAGRLRASFRLLFNRDITAVNMTSVESLTPDPDSSNNNAETISDVLAASNLALSKNATGEEQQVNQTGLMFNNAVFGQAFPTAPNYFVSTRVTAGRRIQYQLTVTNPGTTLAENVVLTDRLPPGVRIYQGSLVVTSSPVVANPGTCVTGTPGDPNDPLVCGLGTLRPFSSSDTQFDDAIPHTKVVTFEVIVDDSVAAGTVLENDASVTSSGLELDNSNNYDFTQNTVLAAADLQALKTSTGQNVVFVTDHFVYRDLPNQVTAGYVLRSSITIQNNGPSDSQFVTVQDQLPDVLVANGVMPLTFLRAENADCRPDAVHARDVFCSLGTMAAGERRTFDIYTLANEAIPDGTVIQNCATALSGGSNTSPPGAPANPPTGGPTGTLTWDPLTTSNANQSCTSITVNQASGPNQGLAVTKSGPAVAGAGEIITYTLTVTNSGPGSATGVVVTDFMPAALRNMVISPSQGSCVTGVPGPDSDRPLVCNLGTVAAGASATIGIEAQIVATVTAGSTIFNDVQVTSSSGDANNSDNVDTVSTSVNQTCTSKPLPPTLQTPNGGVTPSRYVLLDWANTSCATRYVVKAWKNAPVGDPIRRERTKISEYLFRFPQGKTIFWTARACNKIGCSAFAPPISFTTP